MLLEQRHGICDGNVLHWFRSAITYGSQQNRFITFCFKYGRQSAFLDLVRDLTTTPLSALINIKFFNIQTNKIANFYTDETVYFECKSVYFLATFGHSWTIVLENGTESADANVLHDPIFNELVFNMVNCKLNLMLVYCIKEYHSMS